MTKYNLISLSGIIFLMFLAWLCSRDRRNINFRVIVWGVAFQIIFAGLIFWLPIGVNVFRWLNSAVLKVLSFAREGTYFVFGVLAISPGEVGPNGEPSPGFILAFQALPTIIFFSGLMALLYYVRVMPLIIRGFSFIFTRLMHISGAESLCASSNIFVGIESSFTVRPYIETMTKSELCTILTAGMATIASSVMALYVMFLKDSFPAIAGHLISASIISAPAAIIMSKLLYPESEKPDTLRKVIKEDYIPAANWVEAVVKGSYEAVKLCVGIVALLLTFLGLLALVNWGIGEFGKLLNGLFNLKLNLSLQDILSGIFYPLTRIIGVPPADALNVSRLLGERMILTELFSYQHLDSMIKSGLIQDPRSITIATYALCGFAHIASLAIFVGGISALVPGRAKDLAGLGFRSLFGATLACLMTAAVAGLFFIGKETVLR